MRRVVLINAAILLVLGGSMAKGLATEYPDPIAYSGHATLGTPAQVSTLDACDSPEGDFTGIDGQYVDLGEGHEGWAGLLEGGDINGDPILGAADFDMYFYTADCDSIDDSSMAANAGDEFGFIPETARYAFVNLFVGAEADWTLTLSHPCLLDESLKPAFCYPDPDPES